MTAPRKKTPAPRRTAAKKTPPPPRPIPSDEPIIGVLCGQEIEVRPIHHWRKSAMVALQGIELDTWAESALTDDGYDVWEQLDPTFGEIGEFFASFGDEMAAHDMAIPGAPQPNRAQRRAAGKR